MCSLSSLLHASLSVFFISSLLRIDAASLSLCVWVVTWTACFSPVALTQGGGRHLLVIGILADNAIPVRILYRYQCCSISLSLSPSPCLSLFLSLSCSRSLADCRVLSLSLSCFCDALKLYALKGWHLLTSAHDLPRSSPACSSRDHRWLDVHSLQGLCCLFGILRCWCPCSIVNM